MDIKRLSGTFGAEISGVSLSEDLGSAVADELRQAWSKHQVLVFRDQTLTPEQQMRFGRLFGDLVQINYGPTTVDEEGYVHLVENKSFEELAKVAPQGNTQVPHIDESTSDIPARGTALFSLEVPESGGDTLFTNMYAAYEAFSPAMREFLCGLHGSHDSVGRISWDYGTRGGNRQNIELMLKTMRPPTYHPLVRTNPDTGKKSLFFNPLRTSHFKELSPAESDMMREFLTRHCASPQFQLRVSWTPGCLVLWDNRSTLHQAVTDYWVGTRRMHRISIKDTIRVEL